MKRILAGILMFLLIVTIGACGKVDTAFNGTETDEQSAANITSGAAKVALDGNYIYVSRGDRIVRFNPDQVTEKDTLDDFTFKSGNYSDICKFAGKLYAIETVSEERAELVAIDLQSGEEQVIKVYKGDEAKNIWFNNLIGDKLYLWINESIYTIDSKNDIKDTGYRNPLFVTEDGVYVSSSVVDGDGKGLSFIPDDRSSSGVVEYSEMKDSKVTVLFRYGSRLYLTIDNKPAYIEIGDEKSAIYIEGASSIADLDTAMYVGLNYVGSPDKTIICSVGFYDPNGESYSNIYSIDIESGTASLIYRKTHTVVPLSWTSVIDEEVFVGGIADSTDWVTANNHIK